MTWIWFVLAGVAVALAYVLAVEIGAVLARRDVPLPGDRPGWLEEAWRTVRTFGGRR